MNKKKENTPNIKPKDELRNKFASTFKLFDDEGPTVPTEITNVGKLSIKIEDLDPNKNNLNNKEKKISVKKQIHEFDIKEEETRPVEVTNVGKLKFKIEDLNPKKKEKDDIKSKFENLEFTMNSRLEVNKKKQEILNSNTRKHYKVLKFFTRLFSTIIDQSIILALTYLYFIFLIKPSMIKIPYQYLEAITYFLINDSKNLTSLLLGYFIITILYYTFFSITIKSTPFNYILGYKIYRNNKLASIPILILRNIFMLIFNILLLFPFLFMIVSDDKQTLYDKIFHIYLLKEN